MPLVNPKLTSYLPLGVSRFTGASWCTDIRRPRYISVHWHKCIAIHWPEKQSPRNLQEKKLKFILISHWLMLTNFVANAISWKLAIHVFLPWYFIWFCYIFNTYDVVNIIISTINSNSYCDQPGCGWKHPVVDHITLSSLNDLLNCSHVAEHSQVCKDGPFLF